MTTKIGTKKIQSLAAFALAVVFGFTASAANVAKVGDTEYEKLDEALTAAKADGALCELLSDVTLTGKWTPITNFRGSFDGKGYTISGLDIEGEGSLGIFSTVDGSGIVKNLTISGAKVTSTKVNAQNIGVVAGYAYYCISNVIVTGATVDTKGKYVGGIVGSNSAEIKNCQVINSNITGNDQVGGAVGYQWCGGVGSTTVSGGSVTAISERAGGLIGKFQFSTGNDSYMWVCDNTITGVTLRAPDMEGGIAGQIMGCDGAAGKESSNYDIHNNYINVTFSGTPTKGTNPIGVLRDGQGEPFTSALAANLTGNWWEDGTLAENSFVYTSTTAADQTIYRGVAMIGETCYKTFEAAVDAATEGQTIKMIGDATLTKVLDIAADKTFTLDLNGKTIKDAESGFDWSRGTVPTGTPARMMIIVRGTVTLDDTSANADGVISASQYNGTYGTAKSILVTDNGNLTVNRGNVYGEYAGIYVVGDTGTVASEVKVFPTLTLNGGEVSGEYGVSAKGLTATITVNDGATIRATGEYALGTNGTQDWNNSGNCKIVVNGGTIISEGGAAIYNPAECTVDIKGGTLTGKTGIAVKGGHVSISGNAVITATGDAKVPGSETSGYTNTGDALYVEDTYGGHTPVVTVTGGTFESAKNLAVRYYTTKTADKGSVTLTGGTYSTDPTAYRADGYEVKYDAETGKYTVVESTPIAQVTIGSTVTTYSDLNAALEAAKGGAVCELLSDVTLTGKWTPIAGFAGTFDGKGYKITGLTVEGAGYVGLFKTLSSATVKNLTISGASVTSTGDKAGILAAEVSSGTITNVTVTTSTVSSTGEYVGGLFGIGYSSVKGCTVTGSTISGKEQVGGAIGYMWVGHIENCTVTGNTVTAENRAGGLIGKVQFAAGNMGSSTMWVNGNTVAGTMAATGNKDGKSVGGLCGQIMGDCAKYEVKNNTIDVALDGDTKNAIGNLRNGQNAAFTEVLSANITGNWWEDQTLDAAYFDYTNVAEGVTAQRIYRGVAQIGSKAYKTLAAAVAAVQDGDTITLVRDASGDGIQVASGKNFTLDFGGFTYTVDGELAGSEGTKTQGFQLLKDSTIVFTNGTITSSKAKYLIQNYANLTLTGMTLDGANLADTSKTAYTLSTNNGKTEIVNSTIIARSENGIAFDCCCWSPYTDNVVTLTSGTINGNIEVSSYNNLTPSLKLNGGTISGALVMGVDADKVTVTKANAVQLAAPTGYKWDANGKLVSVTYVAQIGEEKYETLAEAVAAVPTASATATTIQMIADEEMAEEAYVSIINKNIVLDLNGKTISGSGDAKTKSFYLISIGEGTTVVIDDSSDGETGVIALTPTAIDGSYRKESCTIYSCGGTLTLKAGKIVNNATGGAGYAITTSSNAWGTPIATYFSMEGGTVSAPTGDQALRVYVNAGQQISKNYVNISGGTILDTGIFVDTVSYLKLSPNMVCDINITGGTINGLVDLKLRNEVVTMNITGGTFTDSRFRVRNYKAESLITNLTESAINISGGTFTFQSKDTAFVATDWASNSAKAFKLTGGTYSVEPPTDYVVDGYQMNKVTVGAADWWVVGEVVNTGDDSTAVVIIEEQTASVDTEEAAKVIDDPAVLAKVATNTEVAGVKLVSSNDAQTVSGAQLVVNEAKKVGGAFAANLEKGTNVLIQVDVEVKPTVYVAPTSGEQKEGQIKFNLQPVATVTIDEGGENKTNVVEVTNEMIDQMQDIAVTVYTGFKPALAVHTDANGGTIGTYAADDITYDEASGNATIIINHFSDVTFFQDSTDTVVSGCSDKDGTEKSVTISQQWLLDNNLTAEVATSKAATANGLPAWQSYVLGLDPNETRAAGSIEVLPQGDGSVDVMFAGWTGAVQADLATVTFKFYADTEVDGAFATEVSQTGDGYFADMDLVESVHQNKRFFGNASIAFVWKEEK